MEWVHYSVQQKNNWAILSVKALRVSVGKKKEKPELYEILNSIKIGDIIYIKSLPFNSKSMKIKAVGIVTAEPKNTNTHNGYEECENEIGVKWLNSDINKSIDVDNDNLRARKGSIFIETNSEYIKKIINFI